MGRKLDALLGRNFRPTKFRPLLNLAVSRLSILTRQRQLRRSQAHSDVLQLLHLPHHHRALLRVEQVIKDQNVLDAYVLIEAYLNLLIETTSLLEQQRECPEELKEAVSGLLFAASRCGDFPELHEIKSVFTTHFGKEFTARAVELRNNCGVAHLLMQKLSTRQPSLESRMDMLKAIASENGIVLQLDEYPPSNQEEKLATHTRQKQQELHGEVGENLKFSNEIPSASKQKYKDVAAAAQAAFESAAQAAAAARAVLELSRSDGPPSSPNHGSGAGPFEKQELNEAEPKKEIEHRREEEEDEDEEAVSEIIAQVENSMPASSSRELSDNENSEMDTETKAEHTEATQKQRFGLNLEKKKPMSVRTRRVRGY